MLPPLLASIQLRLPQHHTNTVSASLAGISRLLLAVMNEPLPELNVAITLS